MIVPIYSLQHIANGQLLTVIKKKNYVNMLRTDGLMPAFFAAWVSDC